MNIFVIPAIPIAPAGIGNMLTYRWLHFTGYVTSDRKSRTTVKHLNQMSAADEVLDGGFKQGEDL